MDRRDFFLSSGSILAAASSLDLFASAASADDGKSHAALAASAEKCVGLGEACLEHCISMMSSGDTSMAACAKSVREMIVMCKAVGQAARQDSKRLGALAKLALDACNDCVAECAKHSAHAVCKACASACEDCAKQCKATAA